MNGQSSEAYEINARVPENVLFGPALLRVLLAIYQGKFVDHSCHKGQALSTYTNLIHVKWIFRFAMSEKKSIKTTT